MEGGHSSSLRASLPRSSYAAVAASEESSAFSVAAARSLNETTPSDGGGVSEYKYFWQLTPYRPCTKPCCSENCDAVDLISYGGGYQTRTVQCTFLLDTSVVGDDDNCPSPKPESGRRCNAFRCPRKDYGFISCDPRNSFDGLPVACGPILKDGGRVTVNILSIANAQNLINPGVRLDDVPGLAPDLYAVARMGSVSHRTRAIRALTGSWYNEENVPDMFFGLRRSGEPIDLFVYAQGGGMSYEDKLIMQTTTVVPACSFETDTHFGPHYERTWLPLSVKPDTGGPTTGQACFLGNRELGDRRMMNATCIRVQIVVQCHNVTHTAVPNAWNASFSMLQPMTMEATLFSNVNNVAADNSGRFGVTLDSSWPGVQEAMGGLILRFSAGASIFSDPSTSSGQAKFKLNYRSMAYFFRTFTTESEFLMSTPAWLNESSGNKIGNWALSDVTAKGIDAFGDAVFYRAYKWEMKSGTSFTISSLSGGWTPGFNGSSPRHSTSAPFVVLKLIPDITPPDSRPLKQFDTLDFLNSCFLFLLPQILFVVLLLPLGRATQFRFDLLRPFILSRSLPDSDATVRLVAERARARILAKKKKQDALHQPDIANKRDYAAVAALARAERRAHEASPSPHSPGTPDSAGNMSPISQMSDPSSPKKEKISLKRRDSTIEEEAALQADADILAAVETLANPRGKKRHGVQSLCIVDSAALIASSLLEHPDTLRAANARRRALRTDIEDFQWRGTVMGQTVSLADTIIMPTIMRVKGGQAAAGALTSFLRSASWDLWLAYALLAAAPLLNLAHGILLIQRISPPSFGLAVLLLGNAAYLLIIAGGQFAHSGFRPTPFIFGLAALASALVCLFLLLSVLLDTEVRGLSLKGLAALTALATYIPLVFQLFAGCEELKDGLNNVADMVNGVRAEDRAKAAASARRAEDAATTFRGFFDNAYVEAAAYSEVQTLKQVAFATQEGRVSVDVGSTLGLGDKAEPAIGMAISKTIYALFEAADCERRAAEEAALNEKSRIKKPKPNADWGHVMPNGESTTVSNDTVDSPVITPALPLVPDRGSPPQRPRARSLSITQRIRRWSTAGLEEGPPPPLSIAERAMIRESLIAEQVSARSSLGLTESEDAALRVAAVAGMPWLRETGAASLLPPSLLPPLPQRSISYSLASLLGSRVFSFIDAAKLPDLEMLDGFAGFLSEHPAIVARSVKFLHAVSSLILVLHVIAVFALFDSARALESVAFVVSLWIADLTLKLLLEGGLLNTHPLVFATVGAILRVFLCAHIDSGEWFAGISLAYATIALPLGLDATINYLPTIPVEGAQYAVLLARFDMAIDFANAVARAHATAAHWQEDWVRMWRIQLSRPFGIHHIEKRLHINQKPIDNQQELAAGVIAGALGTKDLMGPEGSFELKLKLTAQTAALQTDEQRAVDRLLDARKKDAEEMVAAAASIARTKARFDAVVDEQKKGRAMRRGKARDSLDLARVWEGGVEHMLGDDFLTTGGAAAGTGGVSLPVRMRRIEGANGAAAAAAADAGKPANGSMAPSKASSGAFFTLSESWPALRFLTGLYTVLLLAQEVYFQWWEANGLANSFIESGLYDQAMRYPQPVARFWGLDGVPTTLIGLSAMAVVWIPTSFAAAAVSFVNRKRRILTHQSDVLVPVLQNCNRPKKTPGARYNLSLKLLWDVQYVRLPYPIYLSTIAWVISISFSLLLMYAAADNNTKAPNYALPIAGFFGPPMVGFFLLLIQTFVANGYDIAAPGRLRPKVRRIDLVITNIRAGAPLARTGFLQAWRRGLTQVETRMLEIIEFGPDGDEPSLFSRPCIRGEIDPEFYADEAKAVHKITEMLKKPVAASVAAEDEDSREDLRALVLLKEIALRQGKTIEMIEGKQTSCFYYLFCCCVFTRCPSVATLCSSFCTRFYTKFQSVRLARLDMAPLSPLAAFFYDSLAPADYLTLQRIRSLLLLILAFTAALFYAPGISKISALTIGVVLYVVLLSVPGAVSYVKMLRAMPDIILFNSIAIAISFVFMFGLFSAAYNPADVRDTRAATVAGLLISYWGTLAGVTGLAAFFARRGRHNFFTAVLVFISVAAAFILTILLYAFGTYITLGSAALAATLLYCIGLALLHARAYYGNMLPGELWRVASNLVTFIAFVPLVLSLLNSTRTAYAVNFVYAFSWTCIVIAVYSGVRGGARLWELSAIKEGYLAFGPALLPVFSFNPETALPLNENNLAFDLLTSWSVLLLWGILLVLFENPVWIGVSTCTAVLAIGFVAVSLLGLHPATAIGSRARYLDADAAMGARALSLDTFYSRRRLIPVHAMLESAVTASCSPVDYYANTAESNTIERKRREQDILKSAAMHTYGNGIPTKTALSAKAALKQRSVLNEEHERAALALDRELSFVDMSVREHSWHASMHRVPAAGALLKLRLAQWSIDNAWPWAVPDALAARDGTLELLSRLHVVDERFTSPKAKLSAGMQDTLNVLPAALAKKILAGALSRLGAPRARAMLAALGRAADPTDALVTARALSNNALTVPLIEPNSSTSFYLQSLTLAHGPSQYGNVDAAGRSVGFIAFTPDSAALATAKDLADARALELKRVKAEAYALTKAQNENPLPDIKPMRAVVPFAQSGIRPSATPTPGTPSTARGPPWVINLPMTPMTPSSITSPTVSALSPTSTVGEAGATVRRERRRFPRNERAAASALVLPTVRRSASTEPHPAPRVCGPSVFIAPIAPEPRAWWQFFTMSSAAPPVRTPSGLIVPTAAGLSAFVPAGIPLCSVADVDALPVHLKSIIMRTKSRLIGLGDNAVDVDPDEQAAAAALASGAELNSPEANAHPLNIQRHQFGRKTVLVHTPHAPYAHGTDADTQAVVVGGAAKTAALKASLTRRNALNVRRAEIVFERAPLSRFDLCKRMFFFIIRPLEIIWEMFFAVPTSSFPSVRSPLWYKVVLDAVQVSSGGTDHPQAELDEIARLAPRPGGKPLPSRFASGGASDRASAAALGFTRTHASPVAEFSRLSAQRAILLNSLTSFRAIADSAALSACAGHPLYAPVPRPDRPWTLGAMITDELLFAVGPFKGVVAVFGCTARMRAVGRLDKFLRSMCCANRASKGGEVVGGNAPSPDETVGFCFSRRSLYSAETIASVMIRELQENEEEVKLDKMALAFAVSHAAMKSAAADSMAAATAARRRSNSSYSAGVPAPNSIAPAAAPLSHSSPTSVPTLILSDDAVSEPPSPSSTTPPDTPSRRTAFLMRKKRGRCELVALRLWWAFFDFADFLLSITLGFSPALWYGYFLGIDEAAAIAARTRAAESAYLAANLLEDDPANFPSLRSGVLSMAADGAVSYEGRLDLHSLALPSASSFFAVLTRGAVDTQLAQKRERGAILKPTSHEGQVLMESLNNMRFSSELRNRLAAERPGLNAVKGKLMTKRHPVAYENRAEHPPPLPYIANIAIEAGATAGVEYYEELRALLHSQLVLCAYGDARRDVQLARFPTAFLASRAAFTNKGVKMPPEERTGIGSDVSKTAEWIAMQHPDVQQMYVDFDDLFEDEEAVDRAASIHNYKQTTLAKVIKERRLAPQFRVIREAYHSNAAYVTEELTNCRSALRISLGIVVPPTSSRMERAQTASSIDSTGPTPHDSSRYPSGATAGDVKADGGGASSGEEHETVIQVGPSGDQMSMKRGVGVTTKAGAVALQSLSLYKPTIGLDPTTIGQLLAYHVEKKGMHTADGVTRYRSRQFVDPDFMPGPSSIGSLEPQRMLRSINALWRPSIAYSRNAQIFVGGTDPDDVVPSFPIADNWLLTAACMLSSSGTLNDTAVDPLIDSMFITKRMTTTGVNALRVKVGGEQIALLLDDLFPALGDSKETPRAVWAGVTPQCAGAATAHSAGFGEIWVSLMEKAMAKIYGSYAELNSGFIEHALETFTCSTTSRVPIQLIATGPLRGRLWRDLKRWVAVCGFLVAVEAVTTGKVSADGVKEREKYHRTAEIRATAAKAQAAAAVSAVAEAAPGIAATAAGVAGMPPTQAAANPDAAGSQPSSVPPEPRKARQKGLNKELDFSPAGLAEGCYYVVYDVIEMAGVRLVRVREPPGVKSSFKGPFSTESHAWTPRLATELNYSPDNDFRDCAFWMTFDDFVLNFVTAFVCRIMPTTVGSHNCKKEWFTQEAAGAWLNEAGTTGGLCSRTPHAPHPAIHCNPQWELTLKCETTIAVTLHQSQAVIEQIDDEIEENRRVSEHNALIEHHAKQLKAWERRHTPARVAALLKRGQTIPSRPMPPAPLEPALAKPAPLVKPHHPVSLILATRMGAARVRTDAAYASEDVTEIVGASMHPPPQPGLYAALALDGVARPSLKGATAAVEVFQRDHPPVLPPSIAALHTVAAAHAAAKSDALAYRKTKEAAAVNSAGAKALPEAGTPPLPNTEQPSALSANAIRGLMQVKKRGRAMRQQAEESNRLGRKGWGRPVDNREARIIRSLLGTESGTAISPWDMDAFSPTVDATDGRIYALSSDTFVATSGTPRVAPTITLHATLPPGRYVLIAATKHPGSEGGFALSFEATRPVSLLQVFPPKAPGDDVAAKERNMGSASTAISASLVALNEQLASNIVGPAQKKASEKRLAMIRKSARKQTKLMTAVKATILMAGIDSPLPFDELVIRFFNRILAGFAKRIGVAGAPCVVERHLDKARWAEADLRAGRVGARYGMIRAACLHDALRRASRMPEPTRLPSSNMTVDEAATFRARDDHKAVVSALTSASGSAGDSEVAILLRLFDLPFFRHEEEELRPIPGMEILSHLPINLTTLSEPLRDKAEMEKREVQQAEEEQSIIAHFKNLMMSDSERVHVESMQRLRAEKTAKRAAGEMSDAVSIISEDHIDDDHETVLTEHDSVSG